MAVATSSALGRVLERRPSLSGEQVDMIRRLTHEGDGVAVVVGQAGAGKTYALAAAAEAWEDSGRRVYGAALARRAARELEDSSGIPSTSVTALLSELERRPYTTLRRRSVLVLDEAGMLPTRELATLVDHVSRLDVELVLVGDHRQLPSIGAGGAFQGLLTRLPAIVLEENRRQVNEWERDALRLVRDGAAHEAVERYEQADRVVVGEDAGGLRQRLVADWWATRDPGGALMIAQRRVDVADLNGRAHALMRAAGALGVDELRVGGASFSVGDHVVVRCNDRARGVVNGDRGVVVAIDAAGGRIDLDVQGRRASLDREYLERPTRHGRPALEHGYAITGHLAQGMTCRQTFTLATDALSREAGYVALSRGRDANRIYALAPPAAEREEYAPSPEHASDARSALIDALGRSRAQTLASDVAEPARLAAELAEVRREQDRLIRARTDAQAELRRLERERPPLFRPKARAEHAAALSRATEAVESAGRAQRVLESHEEELRNQLSHMRAARQPELVREPLFRERGAGRGLGH